MSLHELLEDTCSFPCDPTKTLVVTLMISDSVQLLVHINVYGNLIHSNQDLEISMNVICQL